MRAFSVHAGGKKMKRLILVLAVLLALFMASGACAQEAEPTIPATEHAGSLPDSAAVAIESVPETYAELKKLYLDALERIAELEAAIQEALDLARDYRADWAEERAVAEARKGQADEALEMANTLTAMIGEMKDLINKQHEIIMKLTKPSVGLSAGFSLQRAPDGAGLQPGITLGVVIFP